MFGERLRKLRQDKKMRQEDIANTLDIGRTTYAMYEQGKRQPDYETLQKIADFFSVSLDYLLTGKEHNKENENLFFFDMEGLTSEEIEDIKQHIEYVKWKSKQKEK